MTPVTPSYNVSGGACVAPVEPLNPSWSSEDWSKCRNNQGNVTVTSNDNTIHIDVIGELESWASSQGQGTKKWIALDVNTGTNDITQVKYNGYDLTSVDVAEANEWSLPAGHFVLWVGAEDTYPKTFTLSGDGYKDTTVTITLSNG